MTNASPPRRQRRGGAEGEPLPIALPIPPALPGRIRPEAPVPCAVAFDHDDYRFSIDWDGTRTLLFAGPDEVMLQAGTLADVGRRYPEIVAAAAGLRERRAVLDGVITVLDPTGCPDLIAFGERQAAGPSVRQRLPTVFLAFDLLHLDGAPTMRLPLDGRLELLKGLELGDSRIQVPDWVAGEGLALADAASPRGLPALLARRGDAAYTPGVAGAHRLRISLIERAEFCIVGADRMSSGRRSLRIAERVDGRPVEVGVVGIAETALQWRWAAPAGRIRPGVVATVAFAGRQANGELREPDLLILRDDIDPGWCVRRDPVAPPASRPAAHGGFRPTVLSALPIGD